MSAAGDVEERVWFGLERLLAVIPWQKFVDETGIEQDREYDVHGGREIDWKDEDPALEAPNERHQRGGCDRGGDEQ
jgi:hypothetical protein